MNLCTERRFRNKTFREVITAVAHASSRHHLLRQLEENSRTAMLCFAQLESLATTIAGEVDSVMPLQRRAEMDVAFCAYFIFRKVATTFCETIDLGSDRQMAPRAAISAFRLTLGAASSKYFPPADLIHRFGIVGNVIVERNLYSLVADDFVLKTGQYWMSSATAIILASCVDANLKDIAWVVDDVLPNYVAVKVGLAAASAGSRRDFFQFLALNGPDNDGPNARGRPTSLTSVTLSGHFGTDFGGEDGFDMENFKTFLTNVEENDASYIFTNGRHGCYADVFFVAKGVVALFLVKDSVIDYTVEDLRYELSHMGLLPGEESESYALHATELLCDAAGIDRSDVVFTRVCRRGIKKEKMDVQAITPFIHVFDPSSTSAPALMYPLQWPPVPERFFYGVLATISLSTLGEFGERESADPHGGSGSETESGVL